MKISKRLQLIVLIIVLIAVGYYFYTELKKPTVSLKEIGLDDFNREILLENLLDFKVMRDDLTNEQIEKYIQDFENNKKIVLSSFDAFDFSALHAMAMIKKRVGDAVGARDILIYISQKRPSNSLSFFSLGQLYMEDLQDNNRAELYFLKALENSQGESGNEQYYFSISDFYSYYYPEKIEKLEEILLEGLTDELYQNNQTLMSLLATYYQNTDQKEKALEMWQKVLQIDPSNSGVMAEIEKLYR